MAKSTKEGNKINKSNVHIPRLLSDLPEKDDYFGGHSAISKSLAEIIMNDNEGRCVAIQGSWGSGKSTVISILSDKLKDKADIFVYDTWSNQGDPLRFSFMNALSDWLDDKSEELKKLAGKWKKRIEDTARNAIHEEPLDKAINPKIASWLGALLFVALPVGIALSSIT